MEYAIKQVDEVAYEVAKFEDGSDFPITVYTVAFDRETGRGRCNCPAAEYHHTGNEDKHVKMVRGWLRSGAPLPAILRVA